MCFFFLVSYVGSSLKELEGLHLTCLPSQLALNNGVCGPPMYQSSGEQSIETLGLDYISVGGCIGTLFGYCCFTFFISYLAIRSGDRTHTQRTYGHARAQ